MMTTPQIENQRAAWESWNAEARERSIGGVSTDQRDLVLAWLARLRRRDLDIIDVGCGAGWLCSSLTSYGRVTGTDLASDLVERAQQRWPDVRFVGGDFMSLPFEANAFDAVISLEVLSHVEDQPAFIAKLARLLRPNGMLLLATQNRPVLERLNNIPPSPPGALRRWVDRDELRALLAPHFDIWRMEAITPRANRYPWKLVCNNKVDPVLERVFGDAPKRFKERLGWGWTLMTLGQKRIGAS